MKKETKIEEGMKLADPRDTAKTAPGTIDALGTAEGIEREREREELSEQIATRPLEEPSVPTVDDIRNSLSDGKSS